MIDDIVSLLRSNRTLIFMSFFLLLVTTAYQIYAQHSVYGSGPEGWFLAFLMDAFLICIAAIRVQNHWLKCGKYVLLAVMICHILVTLERGSIDATLRENWQYREKIQNYERMKDLYSAIPASRITDRKNTIEAMTAQQREIQSFEPTISESLFGSSSMDIRTRIRWINVFAQLLFAHLLAYLLRTGYNGLSNSGATIWQDFWTQREAF